ncbi:MAG: TolC family protein [Blastocatellia bacterium]
MNRTLIFRALNCLIVALMVCAGSRALAQDAIVPSQAPAATKLSAARRITLEEAKDQAVNAASGQGAKLAQFSIEAAKQHRLAAQADYFPKVGAVFANFHFNKFLGQRIQIADRSVAVPLMNKDQTIVAVTVTQPVTPLFKVHEAIKIARADERIAQAKAGQTITQITTEVEQLYFRLLIAQRRRASDEAKVKLLESRLQLASASTLPLTEVAERQAALSEATKALVAADSQVIELTQSLNALTGLPAGTELELVAPLPPDEKISLAEATAQAMANNAAVIEAEQTVVKARAASRLSKLEYIPDVAILGGYAYQTAIPLLPNDFSFIGVMATFNVFDFGKRERTIKERKTQVDMAETALTMAKAQVGAGVQKSYLDLQRTRRILDLTRQLVAAYQSPPANHQEAALEAKAARAKAEAEMFQAELDYRVAYAQLKRVAGEGQGWLFRSGTLLWKPGDFEEVK